MYVDFVVNVRSRVGTKMRKIEWVLRVFDRKTFLNS